MKKLITTHNKMFHTDEVTVLLKIFTKYEIERTNYNIKDSSKYYEILINERII